MNEKRIAKLAKQIAKFERQVNAGELTYAECEDKVSNLLSNLGINEMI